MRPTTTLLCHCVAPVLACGVVLGAASRTGGSETGNPVVAFSSTQCHQPPDGLVKGGDAGPSEPVPDSRLHCIVWKLDDAGLLLLEVSNMWAGCEAHWQDGSALWECDALHLEVDNASCDRPAACIGGCVYDLSFEIEGVEPGAVRIARMKALFGAARHHNTN